MKILNKPKLKEITCMNCNATFKPNYRDLKVDCAGVKCIVACPCCKRKNVAKFRIDKEQENDKYIIFTAKINSESIYNAYSHCFSAEIEIPESVFKEIKGDYYEKN